MVMHLSPLPTDGLISTVHKTRRQSNCQYGNRNKRTWVAVHDFAPLALVDVSLGRGVDLGVGLGAEVVGVGVGPVLVHLLVELAAVLEVLFLLDAGEGRGRVRGRHSFIHGFDGFMARDETETRGTGWSSNRGSSRGQLSVAYREAGLGDLDHARRLLRVRMRPVPSCCEHDAGNHARFPATSVTQKQSRQSHTAAQPREARLVAPNAGFARVFDVRTPRRYPSITVDASRSDVARWGAMRRECQRGGRRTGALT